jgi:hypothetical protein
MDLLRAHEIVRKSEDPLYTEREMKAALGVIEKLRRENREVVRMVWALVKAVGGEIRISQSVLMAARNDGRVLESFDDLDGHCRVFRARQRRIEL